MTKVPRQGAARTGRPLGDSGGEGPDGAYAAEKHGASAAQAHDGHGPTGWALITRAVQDYHAGDTEAALVIISDADGESVLPAAHFFRDPGDMPLVEQEALRLARGRVLDVGAGAGAHALALQGAGLDVTATEVSEDAASVLRARGVLDARCEDVFSEAGIERWHTVLLLMNGTTLVGSASGLSRLLEAAAARMEEGGCILIDSTDLTEDDEAVEGEGAPRYVGEAQLQVEYLGVRSQPFPVLYADPDLLTACAREVGLRTEVVFTGGAGSYLARITRG